ncbi:MAG: hypothetical protein GY778_02915 [bacterium]|nr:hypothetical protein [bacterium]
MALTAQSEKEEIDRGCEKTKTKPKPAATAVASVPAGKHPAEEQAEAGGPMPRWASAAQTITLDPVWQGKPLQYNFAISNKGESDLTIKLRKG